MLSEKGSVLVALSSAKANSVMYNLVLRGQQINSPLKLVKMTAICRDCEKKPNPTERKKCTHLVYENVGWKDSEKVIQLMEINKSVNMIKSYFEEHFSIITIVDNRVFKENMLKEMIMNENRMNLEVDLKMKPELIVLGVDTSHGVARLAFIAFAFYPNFIVTIKYIAVYKGVEDWDAFTVEKCQKAIYSLRENDQTTPIIVACDAEPQHYAVLIYNFLNSNRLSTRNTYMYCDGQKTVKNGPGIPKIKIQQQDAFDYMAQILHCQTVLDKQLICDTNMESMDGSTKTELVLTIFLDELLSLERMENGNYSGKGKGTFKQDDLANAALYALTVDLYSRNVVSKGKIIDPRINSTRMFSRTNQLDRKTAKKLFDDLLENKNNAEKFNERINELSNDVLVDYYEQDL